MLFFEFAIVLISATETQTSHQNESNVMGLKEIIKKENRPFACLEFYKRYDGLLHVCDLMPCSRGYYIKLDRRNNFFKLES